MHNRAVPAIVLFVLLGAAVGAEVVRDRLYGEPAPAESVLYVRSGEFLKRASVANASLLADLYWIRTVQYYGGTHLSKTSAKTYDLLYPLLDITSTLDPDFAIVYRFGAIFLAERHPDGPGRPDLSVALLDKGIRADPGKWRYEQDLGFIYYWYLHDYEQAGKAFERGAAVPGAPFWMRSMAAVLFTAGGDRQTSRALWQQLHDTADNEWLRTNAAWRLAQLDALDQIDALERLVGAWTARTGERPSSWTPLLHAGWLSREPVDPTGAPYVLDTASGRVSLHPASRLHPLPVEPGR